MLRLPEQLKVLRHDADHGPQRPVEPDLAADHGRVGVESRAPERSLITTTFARFASSSAGETSGRQSASTPSTSKMPARDPLARDGFGVAVRAGHHHAADARREAGDLLERAAARVPVEPCSSGDAKPRAIVALVSQIVTSRSGSPKGSGRSSVASTSAKMALLAPMPSASVSVATSVKAGELLQLPERELHVVAELLEPLGEAHLTISLSAQVGHRSFEARDIAQPADRQLARGRRIHAARDELARPHLDVERELFVDFLIDRDAPQPRPKGALHVANRTFETPAENRRQVAISAASCSRPASVRR